MPQKPNIGTPLGYQQITALSAATALTVPANAATAIVTAESKDVRWRDDGTDPTTSVGMPISAGQSYVFKDMSVMAVTKFIEQSASAKLNVSYYA